MVYNPAMSEDAATYDAKCEDGMPAAMGMPVSAVTWEEADAADAAAEQAHEVSELYARYMSITSAIMSRPEMDAAERARLVQAAAAGFAERITAQRDAEETRAVKPGLIARMLGAKVTNGDGLGPDAFAVVGDPDKPSTWQLRIDDAEHISGAIQALSPAGFRGQKVELDSGTRAGAIRKIRAAINKLDETKRGNLADRLDALKALDEPSMPSQIVLLPGDEPGTYSRVAMWASNNFRDRTGEIFSADAMRAAVDRFNARAGVKGAANIWHVGHPKWGFAPEQRGISDWAHLEHAAYADGFLFVEGPVTDQRAAAYIAEWAKSTELGTSIEYSYRPDSLAEGGVYSDYDFDRVTVCPAVNAVNPWNPVMTVGARAMPFENERSWPMQPASMSVKATAASWRGNFITSTPVTASRRRSCGAEGGPAPATQDRIAGVATSTSACGRRIVRQPFRRGGAFPHRPIRQRPQLCRGRALRQRRLCAWSRRG